MGDAFNDNVTPADLDGLVTEATNRDQLLMMRVSANIHNLRDIPILNDRYNHLLNEYQEINVLRTDSEDQDKEIERKLKTFMLELNSLKEEINATDEEEMVVLVIKDYLDQVSDLKKKLGSIRSMTSNEIVTPNVTQEEEDRDGQGLRKCCILVTGLRANLKFRSQYCVWAEGPATQETQIRSLLLIFWLKID